MCVCVLSVCATIVSLEICLHLICLIAIDVEYLCYFVGIRLWLLLIFLAYVACVATLVVRVLTVACCELEILRLTKRRLQNYQKLLYILFKY